MINFKKIFKFALLLVVVQIMTGCTKLNEKLNSTLTKEQVTTSLGTAGTGLLLGAAYSDLTFLAGQDQLFSLEENASDESLVPTRGGDWDDNGVWRVVHNHTWTADHSQILSVFNNLNKINFDATNVLGFNPTASQAAQARFLRAYALYYLLDLYGQFPIRNPGENLLLAPEVKKGAEGSDFIISELTAILPDLPAAGTTDGPPSVANADVAKVLLMKAYLQKGAFANPASPTFDPGDMAQVISLGTAIMGSGIYSYSANYFDNFSPTNHASPEAIFLYPNTGGVSTNHAATEDFWNMTLHYNSWDKLAPNAGWNGFSTISDFYNTFNTTASPTVFGPTDTVFDTRLGGRKTSNLISTQTSGIRPGFLVNQQYDEHGVAEKDRKGNPLAFEPAIAADMKETGANLEVTGIRVTKYTPDYNFYGGPAGNDLMIFRYPDVVLMVAEAMLRVNPADPAVLPMVNALRTARGAAPLAAISLVNTTDLHDPNTL
ncbi:MAG: RagB/SusD family nutrient uptake outer membrane protein, partial [Ginsengibacter sp.]